MALYLTHLTLDGEPIGIHNKFGEHYYVPATQHLKRTVGDFSTVRNGRSWEQFVEDKTTSFNHRYLWGSVKDDRTDLEDVLASLRGLHLDG